MPLTSPVLVAALPKSCPDDTLWSQLVARQKDFRLLSLQLAPDAFGSTYERELDFAPDVWENRLRDPRATTFVAVPGLAAESDSQSSLDAADIVQREWLGQLVLLRMEQEDRAKLSANASPWTALKCDEDARTSESTGASPHYHLNGMFVAPAVRGRGIARRLIEHVLSTSNYGAAERSRYTVIVWAKNEPARSAFERCGFKVRGEETHESRSRQELALMLEYSSGS